MPESLPQKPPKSRILALVGAVLAGAGAAALALMGRRKKGDAGESEPDEEVTE